MNVTILAVTLVLHSLQGPSPLTIEAYLALKSLGTVRVAPSSDAVAFTGRGADLRAGEERNWLYLWRSTEGLRLLAPNVRDAAEPAWSDGGAWLSFLSAEPDPGGPRQLWVLPGSAGAEAVRLSDLPGGILDHDWVGDSIVYVLTQNPSSAVRVVWRVAVPAGTADSVWSGDPGVREIAVDPEGGRIVYSTNRTGSIEAELDFDLWILDLDTGDTRPLTDRTGPEVAPVWSADGSAIAFRALHDPRYPHSQVELFRVPATGGPAVNLTDSFDRTVVDHAWPSNGDLYFSAALGLYNQLFALRADGAVQQLTHGGHDHGDFGAAPGGEALFAIRRSANSFDELWRIDPGGAERLSGLNPGAQDWRLARQEMIQWEAPDGLAVEGLLVYPLDYEPGNRYPLLVNPGGGPLRRTRNVAHQPGAYQLFAANGYAVFAANPRSSVGYGQEFATAAREDLAGGELVDILSGVDYVIALGVADPDRIAVYGEGPDASTVAWMISQTPRFDAAFAAYGLGITVPTHASDRAGPIGLESRIFDLLEYDRDPIPHARTIQTPVAIIRPVGTDMPESRRAYQLYRRLSDLGRPVQQVQVAPAVAGTLSPQQRRQLFFRQLRWLDKHLKFGGADLFDFYLVEEWVPGRSGWQMRVDEVATRASYAESQPFDDRFLQITLSFRPDPSPTRSGELQDFHFDPAEAVRLAGADSVRTPAGTVADLFDRETLVAGVVSPIRVPAAPGRMPGTLSLRLAFEIPARSSEYHLQVEGFRPVRVWVEGVRNDEEME